MQRVQTKAIMLEVTQAVELEPGVILPPGYYPATETRSGLGTISGDMTWAAPQYKLEFSAEELAKMGVKGAASQIFVRFDVTEFVRLGQFTVS